jgi:hypothetical protein
MRKACALRVHWARVSSSRLHIVDADEFRSFGQKLLLIIPPAVLACMGLIFMIARNAQVAPPPVQAPIIIIVTLPAEPAQPAQAPDTSNSPPAQPNQQGSQR